MNRDKVILVFLSSDNLSENLAYKIVANLKSEREAKMIFNLTQLNFEFETQEVIISYYILDEEYPDKIVTFQELLDLLKYNYKLT
ncbi:hypothetical protein ACN9QM_001865 [Listeria monocytogenes]|uniref:hypothetical protein n=1 Tax=Listeria monocytogenes TaxID=1639 RepID=UPI0004F30663|nr:hypothetical protein [Listeria monocytogenes]EAE5922829.1 hypothetical protein [Listeria monocytogenes]EAF5830610.1 hypothetical protein [Listeria monocytogenes]EAF6700157.1 hypothetical protein [Listeria monocytogenes]EAG6687987.1 hypothetical protein [Listeria monocytogenes]EAG9231165.1 hypothetical protein [Listeria monocytogenes]